jgi:hypothetical protein
MAIRKCTGDTELGIRMHWLYFTPETPRHLEDAGYLYDSSFGYNDAVGFRAGTTQAFRPLGIQKLIELPLHIQDTALFYKDRLNLSESEARKICHDIISNMNKYGGVITILWHLRSISPDRLWGALYEELLNEARNREIWITNSREVVDWFKSRRELLFEEVMLEKDHMMIRLNQKSKRTLPNLCIRVYMGALKDISQIHTKGSYSDYEIIGNEVCDIGS